MACFRHSCFLAAEVLLALLTVATATSAQTKNSYPMLMKLHPIAVQIGQSSDHDLTARYNLAGADRVIIPAGDLTGEIIPNEKEKPEDRTRNDIMNSACKIRFSVPPDVTPGVRDYRLLTPHGASTIGQVVLTRDPVVVEVAENNPIEKAQQISLPATVCGVVEKAEDIDFYRFKVEAGTKLTFHLRSQRLMNRLHDMQVRIDPMMTLRNASGSILAANDNTFAGDPFLYFEFPAAGDYVLEVRDVRYQGNPDWAYSVEINSRPFVTQVHPMAIQAGTESRVSAIGYNLPADNSLTIKLPGTAQPGLHWVSSDMGGMPTNEFGVLVSSFPIRSESADWSDVPPVAPPDSRWVPAGEPVSLPAIAAGQIAVEGEIDRIPIIAKAKEKFSFEVMARRANSGMDPMIRLVNDRGAPLFEMDDGNYDLINSADSLIENWTCPADGVYFLEVRDLHLRGGREFTYAVQISRAEPYFLLRANSDKSLLAPGMGTVIYVRGDRRNGFSGDIELAIDGLPPGVTATAGRILENGLDGCIILQAAADAPRGAANIRITGSGKVPVEGGEPRTIHATAHVLQEYYSPGGGRGVFPVDSHTVSVAEPMDIRAITMSANEIVLKPGESKSIEVTVERAPDYQGNITLDAIFQHLEQPHGTSLPRGVKVDVGRSKTLLNAGQNSGVVVLTAANDAPEVERQLIPVNVHVSINFVMKHTFCSGPVYVSVKK